MGPLDLAVAEAFGFVFWWWLAVVVLGLIFTGDPMGELRFEPEREVQVRLSVSPKRSGWRTIAFRGLSPEYGEDNRS